MIHDGAAFGPAGRRTGFAPKGPRVPRGKPTCQEPPSFMKTTMAAASNFLGDRR